MRDGEHVSGLMRHGLGPLFALGYGVSATGRAMFEQMVDPRLEQLVADFKKLDDPLKDHVLRQIDFLVRYLETKGNG
jgi:hypothetical protein